METSIVLLIIAASLAVAIIGYLLYTSKRHLPDLVGAHLGRVEFPGGSFGAQQGRNIPKASSPVLAAQ
jgi:hypothetical protein